MRIASKISLSLLVTAVILTTVAVTAVYRVVQSNLEKAIYAHLTTVAKSRASHIETFLEEHRQTVELLAAEAIFKELFSTAKDNLEYSRISNGAYKKITNVTEIHKEILEVIVLDKSGTVVAAAHEASVGSDRSADESYLKGKESTRIRDIHISKVPGRPAMEIAVPVFLDGELLGVVVAALNVTELFQITADRTGLGETGEIYLINKDAYMISPSRFMKSAVLTQRLDTTNATNCLIHKDNMRRYGGER